MLGFLFIAIAFGAAAPILHLARSSRSGGARRIEAGSIQQEAIERIYRFSSNVLFLELDYTASAKCRYRHFALAV
jgi:hypothetical protein